MLAFDIDDSELQAIAREYAATPKQVDMANNRAVKRTAATLRRLASTGLKSELGLRNATALRRRIKEYRVGRGRGSLKLWFGANDLPLSAFKGRPQKVPGGIKFGDVMIHGGFFARRRGKRGIYTRTSKTTYPIEEARMPVSDRMLAFIEDNVFVDLASIYFKHFVSEIRARTILGVG